jgi:L-iditol 2-dehydrogenase
VVGQAAPSVDGLPLAHLQRYEIDLVTAFRYAHAYPTAIALVASGAVDIERVITGHFKLDDTAEALQAPVLDLRHLKVVVTPTHKDVHTWL